MLDNSRLDLPLALTWSVARVSPLNRVTLTPWTSLSSDAFARKSQAEPVLPTPLQDAVALTKALVVEHHARNQLVNVVARIFTRHQQ